MTALTGIGYQLFYGIAAGLAFQMGINIAQANARHEDMSSVTAIVFFFQTIGGAFSISAAQSGFATRLIGRLAVTAPDVNPAKVFATGATQIRNGTFPPEQIPGIVLAYMAGIKVTLAIVVGLVGFTCLIALLVPWSPINKEALKEAGGGIA